MTAQDKVGTKREKRQIEVLEGIYRLVKSIDAKVEDILDEMKSAEGVDFDEYAPKDYRKAGADSGFYDEEW